jgi:hypothetical protein
LNTAFTDFLYISSFTSTYENNSSSGPYHKDNTILIISGGNQWNNSQLPLPPNPPKIPSPLNMDFYLWMFSLYAPCGPKIVLIKLSYLILSYLCKTLGSINIAISMLQYHCVFRGRRGRHRMVVGFIITTNVVCLNPNQARCARYNYVIKFVSETVWQPQYSWNIVENGVIYPTLTIHIQKWNGRKMQCDFKFEISC